MILALISVAVLIFLAFFFKFVKVKFVPQDSDLLQFDTLKNQEINVYDGHKGWVKLDKIVSAKISQETFEILKELSENANADTVSHYLRYIISEHINSATAINESVDTPEQYGYSSNIRWDSGQKDKRARILLDKYKLRKNSPNRYYWIREAVKDGIIKPSELNKVPSKYMRMAYPEYIRKV